MGLTVKRSEISCCEKVFEYSMPLEEASETVVPDTMPDVERILCADGTALIRSKELGDGHISLAGSVQCTVLYAPEGGAGICALDVGIPAALELDAPGRERGQRRRGHAHGGCRGGQAAQPPQNTRPRRNERRRRGV